MTRKAIYTVVLLIGLYVICQAVADVAATKLVDLGGIVMPGGTLIFALTFTLRDMLHKRLGKTWAQAAIIVAGGLNIFQAGYLYLVAHLPAPVFYQYSEAWSSIFAFVPAITLASITAEVVSELIDTEVYHAWAKKLPHFPQWSRVLVSNAVSLPIDSIIFATLAFVILPPLFGTTSIPFSAAWALVAGQIMWKAIMTLVSMPLIYTVKDSKIVPEVTR